MYQIICITDGEEHVLMDMRDDEYTVQSPILTLQLNGVGSLQFTIHPDHPEVDCIKTLTSIVKVYKITGSDKKWIFTGRVMTMEHDIRNSGKVDCEGILAYLCDSIVRPYEYQGTPADYVLYLINSHNEQVDERKRFKIGTLDLSDVDSNNNIVRANRIYPDTLSEMNEKVVKLLNAYISVREELDAIYFDCNQTITHINTQHIRFGENIIDINRSITAEKIRTVIIGIGAADDEGNKPVVIVENADAISKYGRITGTIEFENVATSAQLERKTAAYLDSILGIKNTVEVKAVDLNMTDDDIEEISLGYAYVTSKHNGIKNEMMLISKMQLYLMDPEKSTFTLGATKTTISSTFSHTSAEINDKVDQVAKYASKEIEYKIDNATQLITGAKGGYVILDCGDDAKSHPTQILIMDTPDKATAKSVIRINKNGIGFSTTGYNGIYRNAWTIDGNLVADFITTGTMLADRIRGGTLEVGGTGLGKDGVISVLNAKGNKVVKIDKDGIEVLKGSIKGTTITAGGSYNADGAIYIKDSSGNTKITIDVNGINVNNAFKVGMDGTITAVAISGGAVDQFSEMIDNSKAMKTAKEAIKKAKEAADKAQDAADKADAAAAKAQSTADTANTAAATAQSAAEKAQSAADTAQSTADGLKTTVNNLNDTIVPKINGWIEQLSSQIKELGKPGIS